MLFVILLLYYPINIYELLSYSYIYDTSKVVNSKFSDPNRVIHLFLSENNIFKTNGSMVVDIDKNSISFNVKGNKYTFDLDKDINKYLPMILLQS